MPTLSPLTIGIGIAVVLVVILLCRKSPAPAYVPHTLPQKRGIGPGTWFLLIVAVILSIYEAPWLFAHLPLSTAPIHIHFVSPTPTPTLVKGTRAYYIDLARKDATSVGIDPGLFVRQIDEESGWNPKAISSAGAIGIAQFMKGTADALGVNPYNPEQSLLGAAKLMASYVKFFHGSYAMALAAYNAGTGRVLSAITAAQKYGGSWEHYLPTETYRYIHIILGY